MEYHLIDKLNYKWQMWMFLFVFLVIVYMLSIVYKIYIIYIRYIDMFTINMTKCYSCNLT